MHHTLECIVCIAGEVGLLVTTLEVGEGEVVCCHTEQRRTAAALVASIAATEKVQAAGVAE